ncbi:unnamed protein product, partial [Owenia fusiformis]
KKYRRLITIFLINTFLLVKSQQNTTCKNGWKKLQDPTRQCINKRCPNTYKCIKNECCRYKSLADCIPDMKSTYEPWPCRGGGSKRCDEGYECVTGPQLTYTACCRLGKCIDENGVEHRPGAKWTSVYDKCNTCTCVNGKSECTDKKGCKVCRLKGQINGDRKNGRKRGKKLKRGETYMDGCKNCTCISKHVSHCKGPCEGADAKAELSPFTPCLKSSGCSVRARVRQCKGVGECLEKKIETEICNSENCQKPGTRKVESTSIVIGGFEAEPNNWRWMVYLFPSRCGGTIISPRHILTAAHCVFTVFGMMYETISVSAGRHDLEKDELDTKQDRTVNKSNFIVHEKWNDAYFNNDIAILVLDEPLELNEATVPILLPKSEKMNIKKILCQIIGWGMTGNNRFSNVLLEVRMKLKACKLPPSLASRVQPESMFCAHMNNRDSCMGDSGGPFMCRHRDNKWVQYGLVSWGPATCGDYSGVYTKLTNYIDWINDKISTDGDWGMFSDWTKCSVSCGGGYQTRIRVCNKPKPIANGKCLGEIGEKKVDPDTGEIVDVQERECNKKKC